MLATRPRAAAPQATEAVPLLALDGISKSFPGVKALDGVSLRLYPGEVTALVGENGAGKSTIVKILTGIYQPDAGAIVLDGAPAHFPTAHAAAAAGVTAIHQETVLFDELSVAENIFLGHAPRTRLRADRLAADERRRPRHARPRRRAGHRPARPAPRPRHRQQAPGRRRPRAVDRRPRRHHGRADRRALAQGDRRALRAGRDAEGPGQGDPLHQPQVRRDLPHRRPLHRVPRRPPRRRGPHRRGHRGPPRHHDGRPRRSTRSSPSATTSPARRCSRSPATATRPSSRTSASPCAAARSSASTASSAPAAASSCRRSSASPGPRSGEIRIDGRPAHDPQPRRRDRPRHRLRPRGPRRPGHGPRPADLPERHAALARPHLAPRLPAARRGVPPRPRVHRAASTCAPPPSTRTSPSSPAATSRRW